MATSKDDKTNTVSSLLVACECPACGNQVNIQTQYEGQVVYDQAVVPMPIAKDLLCLEVDCIHCNAELFIASTHPANLTLILYEKEQE